jgi:hypothetical protein
VEDFMNGVRSVSGALLVLDVSTWLPT